MFLRKPEEKSKKKKKFGYTVVGKVTHKDNVCPTYSSTTTSLWTHLLAEAAEAPQASGPAAGTIVNKKRAILDPDQVYRLVFLANNITNKVGPFGLPVSFVFLPCLLASVI